MESIKNFITSIKYRGKIGLYLFIFILKIYKYLTNYILPSHIYLSRKFKFYHGYKLDWKNLRTLNEKIQWMKINDRNPLFTQLSDKLRVREFISEKFGDEYLIPLVFSTRNINELNLEKFPDFPVIVKANHDSGNFRIIRNKYVIDFEKLKADAKIWLSFNYYYEDREWPYKNIEPSIVVEKLLITKEGKIPNDYKLNFINGNLEFVYVAFDREGENKRKIVDANWNDLPFKWAKKSYFKTKFTNVEIPVPPTFELMKKFGAEIAKMYRYVRVDFYDVDGVLYFGEITQYHGGGFDTFEPLDFDFHFGSMIDLIHDS